MGQREHGEEGGDAMRCRGSSVTTMEGDEVIKPKNKSREMVNLSYKSKSKLLAKLS